MTVNSAVPTSSKDEPENPPQVTEHDEGRGQSGTIKVFVNQGIAVEPPHFLGIFLDSLKGVTEIENKDDIHF